MFIKKTFALLVVTSAALTASCVSAGSVRGVYKEEESANSERRRHLKQEDKNGGGGGGGGGGGNTPAPVPAPVFVAPKPPPPPSGVALWVSKCMTSSFRQCVGSSRLDGCTQCLFAQGQLGSTSYSGVNSCGRNLCNGCTTSAVAFYDCGTDKPAPAQPLPVPPQPVTQPAPAPIAVTVVTSDFTFAGCPDEASSGMACLVPAPFKFQECDYPNGNRCTCAYGYFLCNPIPVGPTPVPPPTTSGGGIITPPMPTNVLPSGPQVCSQSLPKSGDTCSTGGEPWVYCCYNVDLLNGQTPPANYAFVCSCLDGDDRYNCNHGTTGQCTTIINPINPVPVATPVMTPIPAPVAAPVTSPIPAPVAAPVTSPVPAPVSAPVTSPVPAPVSAPVMSPVPAPVSVPTGGETNPDIPAFCLALDGVPVNGTSCDGVLPDSMQSGGCGGEIIYFDADGQPERVETAACSCDKSAPFWMCTSLVDSRPPTEAPPPAAAPTDFCAGLDFPGTGASCIGVLPFGAINGTCTFIRIDTSGGEGLIVSNATAVCSCDAEVPIWMCDGSIPPVTAPTFMPAGQGQPVSMVPVPTAPSGVTSCPTTAPDDGSPCTGLLPAGLDSATCGYSQTVTLNGVVTESTKSCVCDAGTEMWSCAGEIAPAPPASPPSSVPVPVVDSVVPPPVAAPPVSIPSPVAPPVTVSSSGDGDDSSSVGVAIPSTADFGTGSTWCPNKITNCSPCAQDLPGGQFEGSCDADTTVEYEGNMVPVLVQCRCFTQDNSDPVWNCRFVGGTEGAITVPVAPACSPASQPGTDLDNVTPMEEEEDVGGDAPMEQPEDNNPGNIITSIPLTKTCLPRLPTSGLTGCNLPPDTICCHGVQIGIAKVCTCDELNKFQCIDGVPSDCPDEQNPNVIVPLPNNL